MNAPSPLSLGATADIDVSDPYMYLNDTWPVLERLVVKTSTTHQTNYLVAFGQ